MALNDFNNKRQYTKYTRHVNDSLEKVNAETVNTIQKDINETEVETNQIKDTAFEERVYTIFNNNLYTNAMFIDYFNTGEYVNLNESSKSIAIDFKKNQLSLKYKLTNGTSISTLIHSVHGVEIELNDFFLITNESIPIGASINYYLELSTGERWPIKPNALKLPLHLSSNVVMGFKLVAEFKSNSLGESPLLNGYAVLYWDAQVEKNLGLTNPDLKRFP